MQTACKESQLLHASSVREVQGSVGLLLSLMYGLHLLRRLCQGSMLLKMP